MTTRILAVSLVVLTAVLAGLGLIAGFVNREVLDGPRFASHVDTVRQDEAVAAELGQTIADQIIDINPDLVALRPLVNELSVQVIGSDLLSSPAQYAAQGAHSALLNGDPVALRIADAGAVVAASLGALTDGEAVGWSQASVTLASVGDQTLAAPFLELVRWVGLLAWLLPVAAGLCAVLAVVIARDRWAMVATLGRAAMWTAGVLAALLAAGGIGIHLLAPSGLAGAVAKASWLTVTQPVWWGVGILAACSAATVLVCTSHALVSLQEALRQAVNSVLHPRTRRAKIASALAAVMLGIAAMIDPLAVLEPLIMLAGFALIVTGLAHLSRLVQTSTFAQRAAARHAAKVAAREPKRSSRDSPDRASWIEVAAFGAVVLVIVGGVAYLGQPGSAVAAPEPEVGEGLVCNGHADLCDRGYDDVASLATHNAMAHAGDHSWFIPEQSDSIPVQLGQGVRGLLIDVWPGIPYENVVRTAPGSHDEAVAVATAELGKHAVDAALRIADTAAGDTEGTEARYLCHGLCEIGATPFIDTLADIRSWLMANPDEVVTVIIEDHVEPELIAQDIESSGLSPFLYTPVRGGSWPTLGDMIRAGERLVIMLERGEGGADAPWLANAFDFVQDTPYTFPTVESLSCEPNRGDPDAPLFMVNHWLSGFDSLVTDAQLINAREVLLPRVEQCRSERGQIPNLVAVNFSAIGDGQAVVDHVNGLESSDEAG